METKSNQEIGSSSAWGRVLVGSGILLLEYLLLSLLVDAQVVQVRGGAWRWIGELGNIGPFLIVAAAGAFISGKLRGGRGTIPPFSLRIPALLAHGVALIAFLACAHLVFGGGVSEPGLVLFLLWVSCAVVLVLTLILGLFGQLRWVLRIAGQVAASGGVLGLLAWAMARLSGLVWQQISLSTFATAGSLLSWLGMELQADEEALILGLEGFRVHVAPVCSGVEGLGLYLALCLGFLFQLRKKLRFPQAWLLVPGGMVIIWLGNAVRIAALMVLGARVSAEVAVSSFHSKAGWVLFSGITIAIAALAEASPFFAKIERSTLHSQGRPSASSPATPYLAPLLLWLFVSLATSSLSTSHDPLYGLRVLVAGSALWIWREHYLPLLQRPSLLALGVGIAVGVAWLVIKTDAPQVIPGEGWSNFTYFSWLWMRGLGTIFIIPVVEELAFRGLLLRLLQQKDFEALRYQTVRLLPVLGSSIAFGLLHQRLLLATATGVFYALLLKRTGKLIDAITAHAASNAVIFVYVLATNSWQHL